MLNIISTILQMPFQYNYFSRTTMQTLLDFATPKMLTSLLVKERAKCRRRNRNDKKRHLDRECDINELSPRKMLSRIMPPRHTWVRPSKRKRLDNSAVDTSKNAEKALLLTIDRDKKKRSSNPRIYLDELDAFIDRIRAKMKDGNLELGSPQLLPILKSQRALPNGTFEVTCRPLSVYSRLEDKIILSLTSRYLSRILDKHLHENILSYRPARTFHGKGHYVTDFNDGIVLIQDYLKKHSSENIYVADCDIKKFYDTIPHATVIDCFNRILDRTHLNSEGKAQVMTVVRAYLKSYNFYTNAMMEAESEPQVFHKVRKRLHDHDNKNTYRIGWVDRIMMEDDEQEWCQRGVPQGGSLSLIVANVVLNDIDQVIVSQQDENCLFVRYCDDMILMHTDRDRCSQLMAAYTNSLSEHGLYYHDFERVSDAKSPKNPNATTGRFWQIKSHYTFLWGDGKGDCNRYIGFLGYEMRRTGHMRLRRSNMLRFKEKTTRLFYALRRYQMDDKHTNEEVEQHNNQTFEKLMAGMDFYTAFNKERFKKGSQYKYMEKLKDRIERRLNKLKTDKRNDKRTKR